MKKISSSDKRNFDFIVLLTVVFSLFFTSITVSSGIIKNDQEMIGLIQNDSNIKLKEFQRSISYLADDVCDDDCDDDDDDNPTINHKPTAFIFEVNPNPSQEFESLSFIGYGEDDDGEVIAYRWGSNIDGLLNYNASFNTTNISPGLHNISFFVQDDRHLWSDPANLPLEVIENQPPQIPLISGTEKGKKGEELEYKFITTDPNENDILYYIEWGDGRTSGWLGTYSNNEEISFKHTWENKGYYEIKAKAKDVHNEESDWGTMQVSMSRYKGFNAPLLNFLENHPNLFPILKMLLKL
jgi:hypothetical protein